MKIIMMSDELPAYRLCTACRSNKDAREITFAYENGMFRQGVQIALCKECRKDLMEVLKGTDDE